MDVKFTKKNTLADGLIEKASLDEVDDIDEIESKAVHKDEETNR